MKRNIILPVLISSVLLTACGSSSSYSDATYSVKGNSASFNSEASYDSYVEVNSAEEYEYADAESSDASSNSSGDENGLSSEKIKKEMLVYTCNMTVDVLNFDEAIGKFKESLESYGGFVENESYSDGGSDSRWYSEDQEKWQSYSATVRVPSADYDSFCSSAAALGDLRSKNASVENVSSEYYDLSTTLEIYEAKEERYIALLADITDDEYAVTVERELTDLQIEIAKIKTRMNEIRTDVAYSFVNIRINEVKEYTPEPVQKDTFGQRLMNTVSDTASNFLIFLEGLLFLLISLFPYLVLIGIVVFIIIAIRKNIKKRKAAKAEKINEPKTETVNTENDAQNK
ncbi:MAG: DUF4349 domain-containing protein [Huintestinicola sp.]|uniref:DUF4349 domain-containing protein n=1 Tax=Huintestinicola sp. TaxID=2981661 RepID=UPI003F12ABC4